MNIFFLSLVVILLDECFGTYAGSLLKLCEDARNKALAEATVAYVKGVNSVYINPAMLTSVKKPHILYTSNQWLDGIAINSWVAGCRLLNIPFAIGITHLEISDIVGINEKGSNTGIFSASQGWLTVATAGRLRKNLHVGFAIKLYRDRIANDIAETVALDFGYLLKYKERFAIASAIRNLKIIQLTLEDNIPTTFIFGISYHFKALPLVYAAQVQRSLGEDRWTTSWCLEYTLGNIQFRGGFNTFGNRKFDISTGIGIDYKKWGVDFAYTPYQHLGDTWAFSLYIKLGEVDAYK